MPDALKDQYFTESYFDALTAALTAAYPEFDESAFRADIYTPDWSERALMDKMRYATRVLHDHLPADYRALAEARAALAARARGVDSAVAAVPALGVDGAGDHDVAARGDADRRAALGAPAAEGMSGEILVQATIQMRCS